MAETTRRFSPPRSPKRCAQCAAEFMPGSNRARYCGDCSVRRDGFQRGATARYRVSCDMCRKPAMVTKRSARFCSADCWHAWNARPTYGPPVPCSTALVVLGAQSVLPARHPARQDWSKSTGLLFVYGPCRRCGEPFMVGVGNAASLASYCSHRCRRADGKDRRRVKERAVAGDPVRRRDIFERDGWRCQLCGRKVDRHKSPPHPKSPVLDHILPIDALGRHEPANVQCAHFICNSIKGAGVYGAGEQLRLVG